MMTGGGDLDETRHEDLLAAEDPPDEDLEKLDADVDETGGTADGEADAPVSVNPQITDADPDPTAGASDIGGRAGGVDDDS